MKWCYVERRYIVNLSLATHIEVRHGSELEVDPHARVEKHSGVPALFNVVACFDDQTIVIGEGDTEEEAFQILEDLFHKNF